MVTIHILEVQLGDPDSKYISDGERSSILSKFVQEKLLGELCVEEWKDWRKCLRENREKWFGSWRCRPMYKLFDQCQNKYLLNPEEVKKLEEDYLKFRSDYRKTGVGRSFMTKERIREFCEI
uniref:COX assembly mitochondrial protein n=1 Tax=Trichobilharzia regenti TaxID=157069 RepID=A0AA85JJ29_TRIRE|nr:unnamed protein product [Trichobilharzia regenti]